MLEGFEAQDIHIVANDREFGTETGALGHAAEILEERGAVDIEERSQQWQQAGWVAPTQAPNGAKAASAAFRISTRAETRPRTGFIPWPSASS